MNIVIVTRSAYEQGISPLRQRLFQEVCARSLAAQTDRNFTWLISVDDRQARTMPLIDGADVRLCSGQWGTVAASLRLPEVRMVRLDDDDALARDFVERLRALPFVPGRWHVFPNGYRSYQGHCELKNHPTNQFVSLDLPAGDESRHVYEVNHRDVREAVVVDDRPAWLFVRHSESKSPGSRQRTTRPLSELRPIFDVNTSLLAGVQ